MGDGLHIGFFSLRGVMCFLSHPLFDSFRGGEIDAGLCVGGVDVWPDGIFPDVRVPGLEDTSGIVMTVKPIVDNCVGNVLLLLHIEGGDGVKDGISLVARHLFEHFRRGQGRIVVKRAIVGNSSSLSANTATIRAQKRIVYCMPN